MTDRRLERIVVLVTAEEKERLKREAGYLPLSAYLRAKALPDTGELAPRQGPTKAEIPDAATTVGPDDSLPARPENFEQRVARLALRMPKRKAEALARQELDTPPQDS